MGLVSAVQNCWEQGLLQEQKLPCDQESNHSPHDCILKQLSLYLTAALKLAFPLRLPVSTHLSFGRDWHIQTVPASQVSCEPSEATDGETRRFCAHTLCHRFAAHRWATLAGTKAFSITKHQGTNSWAFQHITFMSLPLVKSVFFQWSWPALRSS